MDDRLEALNYLLLVPAEVTAESSALVNGPYANDDRHGQRGHADDYDPYGWASPFYRLEAVVPVTISSISALVAL